MMCSFFYSEMWFFYRLKSSSFKLFGLTRDVYVKTLYVIKLFERLSS